VRPVSEYMAAHIPGSLSNFFRPSFPVWLGWLVPPATPLLFVADGAPVADVVAESLLVGYEDFAGWLNGGIAAWERAGLPLTSSAVIDSTEARRMVLAGAAVLDVREPSEYAAGHIEDAIHLPLGSLKEHLERVPRDRPLIPYCGMGERSTTAISLLERAGFGPLSGLVGGFRAWKEAGEKVAR